MASRIVHLAIADELIKKAEIKDKDRFRIGSLLPDAIPDKKAHYSKRIGEDRKTFDLSYFYERYKDKILTDDLYLGYHLHLLEDVLFRWYMYEIRGYTPAVKGNVEALHNDYSLINAYVRDKYEISDYITLPEGIKEEEIFKDFDFDIEGLLEEFKEDLKCEAEGEAVFFDRKAADMYIDKCVKECLKEMEALRIGERYFNEDDYAWRRK